MANRQKFRHFVSVLAFFCASTLRAQSLSDLERELLLEDSPPAAMERESTRSSPTSSFDSSGSAGDLLEEISREERGSGSDYAYGEEERKDVRDSALQEIDEAISGPRQIPFDHILVVKHRYLNKAERFELAPIMVGIQPADSFRKQLGVGFSFAYHLSEDFALEFLHASFTTNYRTSLEEDINAGTGGIFGFRRVEPVATLGSSIWWAPFKGKSATIENVYHWEAYFHAGGGMTRTEEAFAGMAMFGAGARLYLNKRAVLRLELRDYYDFTANGDHRVNILAGASVLFGEN
jgi:outer membrane beta-barrel protein